MDTVCIFAWIGIGLIILAFLWLALKSNMLRDRVDDPAALQSSAPGRSLTKIPLSYSLSRTQMAVWTVLISCSMIYLYFCKGCTETTINGTALALMGISVGTLAAASMVDNTQIQAAAANPNLMPRYQNQMSGGFFTDILCDENGVSLHRFQHVVWTLISMSIYLYEVARNTGSSGSCLPTLDPTLLVLQGISSAGYVGLKTNENQTALPVTSANNAATPASPPAGTSSAS